jgi:hypothetical protein
MNILLLLVVLGTNPINPLGDIKDVPIKKDVIKMAQWPNFQPVTSPGERALAGMHIPDHRYFGKEIICVTPVHQHDERYVFHDGVGWDYIDFHLSVHKIEQKKQAKNGIIYWAYLGTIFEESTYGPDEFIQKFKWCCGKRKGCAESLVDAMEQMLQIAK